MADDKKNIPEAAPPAEAPAPAVEKAAVPEPSAPDPVLTDAEAVMLEHEGQAALFEMGEAVPDPADAVTHTEVEEPAAPEAPKAEKEQEQPPTPGKDDPAPAHSGKVVDFSAARDEAAKEEKKAVKQKPPTEKDKAAKPGRGRPPRRARPLPIRPSRPNLGTKSPKASPSRRSLPWIGAALPLVRRSCQSRLRPVTPPVPKKRRSFISICLICTRSKIIPLVSGTMRRCRGLWSRSRRQASISPRWCVLVRMAAMRSSQATAASGQVSLPDLRICLVSSAT